ncbi:unnamed protein product [Effrenium voratum]|uniref:Uncharacterized protein n=1 Tax=Effrenium voratum TaxID=2562239 RepID=A0AA36JJ44_9DINO|nr:unnamed protein product [Effrenium voratum]CAJ1432885.1 unnamed protein product [Effrenium voratum]
MTTKYSYKMGADRGKLEKSGTGEMRPHPLYEAMVEMQGEVTCVEEALQETDEAALQVPLDEANGLPAPLFYAVGKLKSPGVVKLLLQSKANPSARFLQSKPWEIFEKGYTPLQAVMNNQSRGDIRMQALGDILRQSEDKLDRFESELPMPPA